MESLSAVVALAEVAESLEVGDVAAAAGDGLGKDCAAYSLGVELVAGM